MKDCRISSREYVKSLIKKFIYRTEYLYINYEASAAEHADSISNTVANNMLKYYAKYNMIKTNMTMDSESFVLLRKDHTYLIEASLLSSGTNMSHYIVNRNNTIIKQRGYSSLKTWTPVIIKILYTPTTDQYIGWYNSSSDSTSSNIWSHCSGISIRSFPKFIMRLK